MKIGEFAKKNDVSIDTVRHYMELSLIIPEKQGGQYDFDERCQERFDEIVDLKGFGFTLREIKTVLLFKTLANLTPYQQDEYYRTLYLNKQDELLSQLKKLKESSSKLQAKIKEISKQKSKKNFILGLDLSALNVLRCSECGSKLDIKDAEITNNQIINGSLTCVCTKEYKVQDGIVIADSPFQNNVFYYDDSFIGKYIDDTDWRYLDNIYKSLEYFNVRINSENLRGKVLVELGSGSGFSLRNLMQKLPEDCVYIAVDHDIKRHVFLKGLIERADIKRNVVFLCCDFLDMPIKQNSVDVLLDFKGTSNYSFSHEMFLLTHLKKLLKEDTRLMAAFMLFKNFVPNSKVDTIYHKNFKADYIRSKIEDIGFEIDDERITQYVEHGGKFEDFFVEGEKVHTYMLTAKMSGLPNLSNKSD